MTNDGKGGRGEAAEQSAMGPPRTVGQSGWARRGKRPGARRNKLLWPAGEDCASQSYHVAGWWHPGGAGEKPNHEDPRGDCRLHNWSAGGARKL